MPTNDLAAILEREGVINRADLQPRPATQRPQQRASPPIPLNRSRGPESDSDDNDEQEGELWYAQGYGRGPLDPSSDDPWSDEEENDDDSINIRLIINDGHALHIILVARHLLEEHVPEMQRRQRSDTGSRSTSHSLMVTLMVGQGVVQNGTGATRIEQAGNPPGQAGSRAVVMEPERTGRSEGAANNAAIVWRTMENSRRT